MATESVTLEGHIIDSLILAKVLDTILQMGGTFDMKEMKVGATREDSSLTKIKVQADSPQLLDEILQAIQPHGAVVDQIADCTIAPAPKEGVLPDSFYATSHLPTQVRVKDQWLDVEAIEMDLAIRISGDPPKAHTVPMAEVKTGDMKIGRASCRERV